MKSASLGVRVGERKMKLKRIIVILFLAFLVFPKFVFADDTPTLSPTPVDYTLPYPGLMPGNILYPFKVVRDRIVEFFITDLLKKSEFYLLQADKHLNAGILLAKKGKYDDSEEIISKGENYLDLSLSQAIRAKTTSESTNDVLNNIYLSSVKHQEVLDAAIISYPGSLREKLRNDLRKAQAIEKSASEIRLKK